MLGRALSLGSERLHAVLRDEESMLELSCASSVLGGGCPIVTPHDVVVLALIDHRLDGEDVPRSHNPIVDAVLVVQDGGVCVEHCANTVPAKIAGRSKASLFGNRLNHPPDLAVLDSRLAYCDSSLPRVIRRLYQLFALFVNLSHAEHLAAVSMVPIVENCDIDVDHIPLLQNRLFVGDAVADHLVDGCADALREVVVVQGGGVTPPLDRLLMNQDVEVLGADTRCDRLPCDVEHLPSEPGGFADARNLLG
mmetsp:Transcript_17809/g.34815  ORF Transcript_17809/g.34815 Transcript_17809/m.34815 type:complete len:251 (-) Transcript_17809:213-965(-)